MLESHEQELMIFIVVEYDARESLHLNTHQFDFMHGSHLREERCLPLIFSSRIQIPIQAIKEDKLEEPNRSFVQARDKVFINWLMMEWICI
jgi:hypothetical protein